jgi:hypothetical protein
VGPDRCRQVGPGLPIRGLRILGHNNRSEVQGAAGSDSVYGCTCVQIEHTVMADSEAAAPVSGLIK